MQGMSTKGKAGQMTYEEAKAALLDLNAEIEEKTPDEDGKLWLVARWEIGRACTPLRHFLAAVTRAVPGYMSMTISNRLWNGSYGVKVIWVEGWNDED